MKFYLNLIQVLLIVSVLFKDSNSIQIRRSHLVRGDREILEEYINKLNIEPFTKDEWDYVPNKEDPTKTVDELKSNVNIATIPTTLTKKNIEKGILWKKVKETFLAEAKNQNDKIKPIMQKFLKLRLMDTLHTITYLTKNTKNKEDLSYSLATKGCNTNQKTFSGTINEFFTPCFDVRIGVLPSDQIKGNFLFRALGSQTLSSDIDFNVNFLNYDDLDMNIYKRLYAMSMFIKDFNKAFKKLHGANSLQTYDINLYASDFANPDLVLEMAHLKKTNPEQWKAFVYTNRIAQLLLVYNDALEKYEKHTNDKSLRTAGGDPKFESLIGNSVVGSENCSEYLFEMTPAGNTKRRDGKLSRNQGIVGDAEEARNDATLLHIANVGTDNMNTFRKLCHVLAANFFALEAYVSYGSILEMLMIQSNGGLFDLYAVDPAKVEKIYKDKKIEHPQTKAEKNAEKRKIANALRKALIPGDKKNKYKKKLLKIENFANSLDVNAVVDFVLMNLAYGVEHFMAILNEENDVKDAISKFAKYFARIYVASFQLTKMEQIKHGNCLRKKIIKLFLGDVEKKPTTVK